jgi:hypothetical protein
MYMSTTYVLMVGVPILCTYRPNRQLHMLVCTTAVSPRRRSSFIMYSKDEIYFRSTITRLSSRPLAAPGPSLSSGSEGTLVRVQVPREPWTPIQRKILKFLISPQCANYHFFPYSSEHWWHKIFLEISVFMKKIAFEIFRSFLWISPCGVAKITWYEISHPGKKNLSGVVVFCLQIRN